MIIYFLKVLKLILIIFGIDSNFVLNSYLNILNMEVNDSIYDILSSEQYPDKPVVFENVPTYEQLFASSDGSDLGGPRIGQYLIK